MEQKNCKHFHYSLVWILNNDNIERWLTIDLIGLHNRLLLTRKEMRDDSIWRSVRIKVISWKISCTAITEAVQCQ